jgi:hypothetical protein
MMWTPESHGAARPGVSGGLSDGVIGRSISRSRVESNVVRTRTVSPDQMLHILRASGVRGNGWEIEIGGSECFTQVTTASVSNSRPIMFWDKSENRNPAAWYSRPETTPSDWNARVGKSVRLSGVSYMPSMWTLEARVKPIPGFVGMLFFSPEFRDRKVGGGLGLFQNFLRQDLREVSSAIQEYSLSGNISPCPPGFGADAVGIAVRDTGGTVVLSNGRERFIVSM